MFFSLGLYRHLIMIIGHRRITGTYHKTHLVNLMGRYAMTQDKTMPRINAFVFIILTTLMISNLIILPVSQEAQAFEQIMEENTVEGTDDGISVYKTNKVAQSYIASSNYTLTNIHLYLKDEGSSDEEITVQLFANDDKGDGISNNDVPSILAISNLVSINGPNYFNWLSFPTIALLEEGERYWIVANSSSTDGEGYKWKDSEANSYSGGYIVTGGNPDWYNDTSNDLMFRVFGIFNSDVGVEEIIAPGLGELNLEVNITAVIMNYGTMDKDDFDVRCTIEVPNGTQIIDDTQTVSSPLGFQEVTFLSWYFTPIVEGVYIINITTLLAGDQNNSNNASSMNMEVEASPVLKLHDDIIVNGNLDDWYGWGPSFNDTWRTSKREYIWTDTVGDDNGDGDYVYPTDYRFEENCLDIHEFRVCVDSEHLNFMIQFGDIDDGYGDDSEGLLGFSEQIIEILIDVDGDGTGRDDTIRNARLRLDRSIGWEYAIWVDGWNNGYIEDEYGDIYYNMEARGSSFSKAIEIEVLLDVLDVPDFDTWRYTVLIGAQDEYSLPDLIKGSRSGFMRVDENASLISGGGGYDINGADSNVYDILFASPQDPQLNNYRNEDMEIALYYGFMSGFGEKVDDEESWAQSFIAPFTCLLSSVDIHAKDEGTDSDEMEIKIHSNNPSDNVPSSLKISSSEYTDFINDDYEWKSVEFSNPAVIRGGETYWIVVRSNDTQGEGYRWISSKSNPFSEGMSAQKIGDDQWLLSHNEDMGFAVKVRRLTSVDMSQPIYFAPIVIDEVYSNGSTDDEWINITYNGTDNGPNEFDMSGWTLTDQDGNIFTFSDYYLNKKRTVCVHSGFGTDGTSDLYWGRTQEVWNDLGDDVLLNSNLDLPVDYMNYTDGNVFGDPPPIGTVWEPYEDENLPKSPNRLQILRLRNHAIDNDLFCDWDLLALGDVKIKTLYLFDDKTFNSSDPTDYMNTIPPMKNKVEDFDDDGYPGLTIKKSDPSTEPQTYQEFNLTPVLAKDLNIVDDVVIHLWVDTYNYSKSEFVIVTLFDRNDTSEIEIANQSILFITDDQKGWELVSIVIPDVDYTLERKHFLTLHVRVNSSSDEDLFLGYNSTEAPSCIKTIPTRTYINIDWGKTYSIDEIEKTDFLVNEEVLIKANISDPFGSYDIIDATVTVRKPGGSGGSPESPMIVESIDPDDPSAWKLFNYTYTSTNNPGEYTVNIEGVESNGVVHTITIYFKVRTNTAPVLFGPSLSPYEGFASTSFNFSINYSDADNNPPGVVTVNITSYGIFEMMALDPGDIDYTDGNVYYLNLTGFVNGTEYSHHFAANDSKGLWAETSEFDGPLVLNTPPSLLDPGLFPYSGNATTSFNFTVNYTDLDNQLPDMITVNITGPSHNGSWYMIPFDQDDTNCTDGKWYYYNYTGFVNGSYTYHFAASDSQGAWFITDEYYDPQVNNTSPTLLDAQVTEMIGYITDEFNFTVIYYDLDNQEPGIITVNISGPSHSGSWDMIEYDPLDKDYIDGKLFYYTYTGLEMGSYYFHCAAKDTQDAWGESQNISFPIVLNSRPTLSDHNLNPTVGETGVTDFNYTVIYTDLDNHTYGNITVNITGPDSGNFTMYEYDPFDTNYTDGKKFYFNTTLLLDGNYSYRIDAYDIYGLWAIPIIDSGPNVGIDAPPVLTEPSVNPEIGHTAMEYNFTVNFTDLQNDSADVILLNLSGPSGGLFVMLEVDPSDENTTDGKYFYRLLTGLEKGYYSFYVEGNDTKGNSTQSVVIELPYVQNSLPQLIGSYINESEYGESWFNFTLTYLDIDDDSPGSVNIFINEIGNFTMNELDSSDMIYNDGKKYYYNITLLKGSYSYCFESVDTGFKASWNYTTFDWIHLNNNLPTVIVQQVISPTGFGGDFFNFTLEVLDLDNEALEVILYIQGEAGSPFPMNELDIFDIDTNDGKFYYFNTTFLKGSYDYNYSFYDGDESNQTIPITLVVKNNPPVIITSDTTSVDEDSPYSVDYNNTDLDGDSVTWSLETNGTWLNIDPDTGILEGTPTNSEVGSCYVNVSVDDGDGGYDFHNFTLEVINTLPLLTTTSDEFAKEDILHLDDFNCIDDGQGSIIYSLETNATWLSIDSYLGILSGTPDNRHVGWYWVNVSVNDGNWGIVSINYTLTVNNTLPTITTVPDQVAQEDILHLDDFNCNDDSQGNITYSLYTNATWLDLNYKSGVLSGTAENDEVGWFWVNITVSDGNGGMDVLNYTLIVVNIPPIITTTPVTSAFEDSAHSDDFDCTDEGHGNIVYTLITNATWINMDQFTGILSGLPDNNNVGWYWINISVDDGNGGTDNINYTLTVINNPPIITNSPIPVVTQDIPHYDDFNCSDDGQGTIMYYLFTNATWVYFNSTSGLLNGTPENIHIGWYWVNVSVTDGNGGLGFINYTLTVDDVNDPPQIITSNVEFADEDSLYTVDYEHNDIDDPIATWQLKSNGTWLAIDPNTGVLSGTPQNDDVGWCWVNVTVVDGRGAIDYTNFTITVSNNPPSVTTSPLEYANEDEQHWDDFDCDDDGQGSIVYSYSTNASWLGFDAATGVLSGTADNTQVGWYWVNVTVRDGNGGMDFRNYTVYVNNTPPQITTIPDQLTLEDILHIDDFNSIDDNQGNIEYILLTNATWLNLDNFSGILSGVADNTQVGIYWVNITVDDGNGGLHSIEFNLTVLNVPPAISTIPDDEAVEDIPHLDDFDCDDDGQGNIVYSLVSNATWLSLDPITGELTGTPNNVHVGQYFVHVTVSDGNSGFDSVNYTLTVINVPPIITNTPDILAKEDLLHSDDFNCTDDGQGNIVYSLLTNATWLNLDQMTGLLFGIPDNSYVGWYWVNVSVVDGNGGMDFRNYNLTVEDVNDPPVITTPNLEFAIEDFSYSVDYNFTDVDDSSVVWQLVTNASWLSINPFTGVLSGTPQNHDVGWYWVDVTADDGGWGITSTNFTLIVNNSLPAITNIPVPFVNEDDLHLDDFDCDDDNQGNITYSLATNASWLGIIPTSGILSGVPENDEVGWFWINITVSDGNGGIDFVNYTLTVINTPPNITTTPQTSASEDSPHSYDFDCDDDNQGSIIYSIQTNASWLSFDNLTGQLLGTPDNDDVGSYWVNITVSDGNGGLDFENYTLEVENTNDPPIITTGHIEFINEDSFYFVDYESSDVDFGDKISWSLITNATWLSINDSTGILSGRPANPDVGWFYVNVNASDGEGYDLVNFIIVVNNTNDAPLRPQLIWPGDDSTINTTIPTFTWNPAIETDIGDHIVDYTLQYSTSADFSENLTTVTDIIDPLYTPQARFEDERTYYWRVEAYDSFGVSSGFQTVLFVFYIDTGYEPPTYNQKLKSAVIMPGESWQVNLDEYFDLGSVTEDLIFTTNYPEIEIDQETHIASWTPASESDNLTDVIFRVFDGTTIVSSGPIDLSVETVTIEKEQLTFWERIYWPWSLFLMIFLIILLGAILVKRYKTRPIVEEVFFISEDGRLIAHSSTRTEEEIDEDILSSMLTGVKDFVSDAFIRDKEERDEKGLNKLEFGEKSILLERGNHYFIALIFTGRDSFPGLKGVMEDIEERYGSVLAKWDGEMRVFKGSDEIISRLLPLEKLSEEEKEKIKDARKKEKVIEKWESIEEETSEEPPSMEELRKEMGWK